MIATVVVNSRAPVAALKTLIVASSPHSAAALVTFEVDAAMLGGDRLAGLGTGAVIIQVDVALACETRSGANQPTVVETEAGPAVECALGGNGRFSRWRHPRLRAHGRDTVIERDLRRRLAQLGPQATLTRANRHRQPVEKTRSVSGQAPRLWGALPLTHLLATHHVIVRVGRRRRRCAWLPRRRARAKSGDEAPAPPVPPRPVHEPLRASARGGVR